MVRLHVIFTLPSIFLIFWIGSTETDTSPPFDKRSLHFEPTKGVVGTGTFGVVTRATLDGDRVAIKRVLQDPRYRVYSSSIPLFVYTPV